MGPRMCIFNKFAGDAVTVGQGPHLENPYSLLIFLIPVPSPVKLERGLKSPTINAFLLILHSYVSFWPI